MTDEKIWDREKGEYVGESSQKEEEESGWLLKWEQSSLEAKGGARKLTKEFDTKEKMEKFIKNKKEEVREIYDETGGRKQPFFRVISKKKL